MTRLRSALRRLGPFHALVLSGAAVNVAVVLMLFGYWVLH